MSIHSNAFDGTRLTVFPGDDCPEPKKGRDCRNCGSTEHIAKECDQPRNPATVTWYVELPARPSYIH